MNEKNVGSYLSDNSCRYDKKILIDSLHLDTMRVKRKRETDGTFLLYVVYIEQNDITNALFYIALQS